MDERITPADLMHEDQVYEKYPNLFIKRELREARKAGVIRWFDLRSGPHYTDAQIMEYLTSQERSLCQENAKLDPARDAPIVSSNTKASGWDSNRGHMATISSIGTTQPRGGPDGRQPQRAT
jgi:hypothetical protein